MTHQHSSRDTILTEAFHLFSRRGYSAVGIQEVCQASGITKPTLYYHFSNKEGLLQAVSAWVMEPFLARLVIEAKVSGDAVMDIRRLIGFYRDYFAGNPEGYRWFWGSIMAPRDNPQRSSIELFRQRHDEILINFFKDLSRYHGNISGKEAYLAISLPGIMNAYLFSPIDLGDQVVNQIAQHFMYGIFS